MIRGIQSKEERGITLIALVVTIIVLIVLAGIAISMTIGENGIFAKAKEAKRLQITTEAKEKIGTEILAAQVEAIERNEELEQAQVEDIISKYGTLQDDKDTIILKDNGYEISLLDIYQGTTTSSGSYTENKAKIELLEGQVKRLQEQLDSMSQTGDEKDKKIAELNERVTTIENEKNKLQNENNALTSKATELTDLKETLSKVTATEGQILKNYTAYKDGKLITGTMANYAGKTIETSSVNSDETNTYATIPRSGYYDSNSKISLPKIKTEEKDIIEKLKTYTSLNLKIKDETNYKGINGYRAILDNSSQKIKSVTITFKRSTTYGYFKLCYSEKYISGYTDQADSNFVAIASYTDMDEHSIKIDMLGHNYLNIADAHTGTIPTVSIADIEFV